MGQFSNGVFAMSMLKFNQNWILSLFVILVGCGGGSGDSDELAPSDIRNHVIDNKIKNGSGVLESSGEWRMTFKFDGSYTAEPLTENVHYGFGTFTYEADGQVGRAILDSDSLGGRGRYELFYNDGTYKITGLSDSSSQSGSFKTVSDVPEWLQ